MDLEKRLILRYNSNYREFSMAADAVVTARAQITINGETYTVTRRVGSSVYPGGKATEEVFKETEERAAAYLRDYVANILDLVAKAEDHGYKVKVEVQDEDC